MIQFHVQLQYVDSWLAENAKGARLNVRRHHLAEPLLTDCTRMRHSGHLEVG